MLTDFGIIFHLPCLACNLSEDSLLQRDVISLLKLDPSVFDTQLLLFQELLRCASPVLLLFPLCRRRKPEARRAPYLRAPLRL
jgi:hypothetical protein